MRWAGGRGVVAATWTRASDVGQLPGHVRDVDPLGETRVHGELEALDEPGKVARASDETRKELLLLLGGGAPLRERLGDAEDHRHGSAELVREPGDEIVPAGGALDEGLLGRLQLPGPVALALERFREVLDHARGDAGREHGPALRRLEHGVEDVVAVRVLQHVPRGPGDEHLPHDLLVLVPGQGHDADVGVTLLQQARGLDTVHLRHAHVHQDDVRLEGGHESQGLQARVGLADHHEVGRVQEGEQRLPKAGVVVDDEDSDSPHAGGGGKESRLHGWSKVCCAGDRLAIRRAPVSRRVRADNPVAELD